MVKAAIIVTPLLGVTWLFGVLAINESAMVFAWIFTVLNSLQVYMNQYIVSVLLAVMFVYIFYRVSSLCFSIF